MAYQATHYHPVVQAASIPRVQIIPTEHGEPAPTSTTDAPVPSSTTTSSTSTTTTSPRVHRNTTTTTRPHSATTQPATTTSGPLPRLHSQISPAGSLVPGHRGAVSVQVTADGAAADHVHLTISATGATAAPALSDGWTCSGTTTVQCDDQSTLNPGTAETVFVALDVAPGATSVQVNAAASAPGAGASDDASTSSQTDVGTGFSARFAGIVRGDVTTIGNTLSTCPPATTAGSSTCEQAEARDPSVTTGQDDNDWPMVPVDADNDPATANSSAASLSTAGTDVLSATLHWSGEKTAGTGGVAASGPIGNALLATPATTGGATATAASYTGITASQTEERGDTYQAVADVTSQVRAAGAGRYWLGGIAAATGSNTRSSWTLTVVYRQAGAAPRTVLVFDGLVLVDSGTQVLQTSGFRIGATASARLGIVAYEGDWGLRSDSVVCGTSAPLATSTRDADNFFNSSITHGGAIDTSGTPSLPNTFGLDIADVDVSPGQVSGCLTPGASSTNLQFSTTSDQYQVGVVTLSSSR